jgi:hypothetical protein
VRLLPEGDEDDEHEDDDEKTERGDPKQAAPRSPMPPSIADAWGLESGVARAAADPIPDRLRRVALPKRRHSRLALPFRLGPS